MSPFNYTKVSSDSSQLESLDQQPSRKNLDEVSGWRKTVDSVQFLRWPVTFFLLTVILICELSIFHQQSTPLKLGSEVNGLLPEFTTQKKTFHTDKRYASDHRTAASINVTKHQWMDLIPRGGGFLQIPDYTSHALPPPMHFSAAPGKQVYAIAVFHELHCLMHLSGYIDKLVMQIRNKDFELDEEAVWHNDHCFNYLRNALLCCGDTTLEGQAQTPELQGMAGTDGTGAVHVCRNFDEIMAFAEKVRLTDAKEHF
ncbi:DUF3328 domain containing protein [Pyrenophora teres f. maculata]|nr:DUF3328 domain containing protein [Pyrenophora teres f. maculata]